MGKPQWPSIVVLFLMAVIGVAFVRQEQAAAPPKRIEQPTATSVKPLTAVGLSALHGVVNTAINKDLRWPDFAPYRSEFAKVYEKGNLVWIQNGRVRPQGLAMIALLRNADAKGLETEDYDGPRWADRLAKLAGNPSEQELVSFDTALTISTMRYVRAVHVGRVNPKQFKFELDVGDGLAKMADFVDTIASTNDPAGEIEKLEPPFLGYRQLLALLPVYENYARKDDGEKLQTTAHTVRPGQPYGSLARLGRFLQLIGDIPADAKLEPNPTVYKGALVEGVKHYQSRHGENPTGLLDARTISELNTPAPLRIRQIKLTLERWRWLPQSFSQPPVVINLPEYRLRAMNRDGTVALYRDVIVGKAYGHKSPIFEKDIQYVVFRPYWEVTPSIQRNETVPHIQKDPGYIAKHNFEVITPSGELVTDSLVSPNVLEGLKSGRLLVRQKPGPMNSLGLVKIIFPNPENVYLHGTDAPQLFTQDVRDLSHGCIRVNDPAELVAWLLRNNAGWHLDRVRAAMNGGKNNVQVNLASRIPVLIVYGTVTVNEENQIRFFDDVYGYDAELEKALQAGYPYAW